MFAKDCNVFGCWNSDFDETYIMDDGVDGGNN